MKARIKIHLAMIAALASATFHRLTQSGALALGNDTDAPPAAAQQQQQQTQRTPAELEKENAELRSHVKKLESQTPKNDGAIRKKMAAGLSREQAEAAVKHQAKFTERFNEVRKEKKA
jgi:cell division protein FtsB